MIARAIFPLAAAALLASPASAQTAPRPLNTVQEVGAAMNACWTPPPLDQSRPGMQITVQFTFKSNGELFGKPRITFTTAGATDAEQLAYRLAVAATLKRCTPLPLTEALGNAIAGRPFTMQFVDQRKLKQAENL